ncbi:hypothetical protein CB1_001888008 [Camelus ferus]|nr:hypothetical protein CB1_001888008 [Camelus ferus]
MGAEKKLLSIKEAFQLAQQPHQNQAKLVVALSRTYGSMHDKTDFHEEFVHYLKYAMVVYKREPAVERVIEFAAKFVTSFHQSDMEDDEEEKDGGILNFLFTFLLKSHEANSNAVRFRVCQLINKLLGNMPENAQIDDDLFDEINEAMLIRLKDKIPNVRIQAVLALSRLQDPKDDECPVVNAYATLIENDSNPEVRRAVLSCIAPSAKTLPRIVGRTKDVKEAVRKLAYQVTEIISEIRAPILNVGANNDPADARKKELKMAEIKVKLIEAKEALENCIALQDFNQASELKEEIKALEDAKINLLKETEQLEIKEVHIEKNDAETLQKCLILCHELLKQMSTSAGIGATMNGIIESLVLQIDDVTIKISALKAIFDQLMTFGFEPFKTKKIKALQNEGTEINTDEEQESEESEEESATAKNVLRLLSDFLDSEVSELRTGAAEGLAKLMFSGLLVSSRLLSRLVLLWYNPVTEEDVRLRHCLGVFFPMFAYASRTNQECFEEAFLPTLQTLANAPASSPLAEIDITNVAELLVDLTRPSGLNPQAKDSQDYQQVKDRTCLRALEKIKIQLEKENKEHGDQVVAAQGDGAPTAAFHSEGGDSMVTRVFVRLSFSSLLRHTVFLLYM